MAARFIVPDDTGIARDMHITASYHDPPEGHSPKPARRFHVPTNLPDRSPAISDMPPLRVLVIEDEVVIALYVKNLLQDLGATVVGHAMTAEEAVALARLHRPDCATVDIRLKGRHDGIDAAQEIFEKFGVPSIFVSAYGNAEIHDRAAACRPLGWIRKPIDEAEFGAKLAAVTRTL